MNMYDCLPDSELCRPVKQRGEFVFAAVGLAHGHIFQMCRGLIEAGATLKWVYDDDASLVANFLIQFPQAKTACNVEQILLDNAVRLVASADIPSRRAPLGMRVMQSGKDFFSAKAPLINAEQLTAVKKTVSETGRKFAVFFSERLASEAAVYAGELISRGVIGRVIGVNILAPHKLGGERPAWFYRRDTAGGILIDIGSHQIEQFLYFTGNKNADILSSAVANFAHKEHGEFDDFGSCSLLGENGAVGHFVVDWFTPDGIGAFGDGRVFLTGTEGTIELRIYLDIGVCDETDTVFVATKSGVEKVCVRGKIGLPYFGRLIEDCLYRTQNAMSQEHIFSVMQLALAAQAGAVHLEH